MHDVGSMLATLVKDYSEDSVQFKQGIKMEGDVHLSVLITEIKLTNVGLDLGNNQGYDDHRSWEDMNSDSSLQS